MSFLPANRKRLRHFACLPKVYFCCFITLLPVIFSPADSQVTSATNFSTNSPISSPISSLWAKSIPLDTKLLFEQIKKHNQKKFGKKFEAELSSNLIKIQMKNIPKETIVFGKKPKLYLVFHQGKKPQFVLKNVSAFYTNFFAVYEDVLQKSGLFLGVDNYHNSQKFLKKYQIFDAKKTDQGFKLSIKEKNGLEGDYATFHYDKNHQVTKAQCYEEKKLAAVVKFFFKKIKKKELPSKVVMELFKEKSSPDHFFLYIEKYHF